MNHDTALSSVHGNSPCKQATGMSYAFADGNSGVTLVSYLERIQMIRLELSAYSNGGPTWLNAVFSTEPNRRQRPIDTR